MSKTEVATLRHALGWQKRFVKQVIALLEVEGAKRSVLLPFPMEVESTTGWSLHEVRRE